MKNLLSKLDDRGVYYLTLNRSNVMNAFDENLIEELDNVLSDISNNRKIRVLVLTGEGKAFSAGGDLDWMKRMANLSYEENHKDAMKLAVMLQKLDILPFPTIAAVNGAAFGGGVGLVSACDIAIGNEYAKFSLSEVRLGLIAATISPYVVRAVGSRNARYLFMTSNLIFPEEAHHLGLLTHYTQNNNFDNVIEKNIDNILKGGPEAIKASKDLVFYVEGKKIDEIVMTETAKRIADARATDEGKEGTNAFLNKIKPGWQKND